MADTRPYTLPMLKASFFPGLAALAAVITVKLLKLDLILGLIVGGMVYLPLAVMLPRLAGHRAIRSR
jgi:hypothetical protein